MTRRSRLVGVVLALVTALVLIATIAAARPGGGSSYSGGGSSSGGGGGGGGGGGSGDSGVFFELLLWLCFEHPVIGIPLTIAVIVFVMVRSRSRAKEQDWSSGTVGPSGVMGDFGPGMYLGRFDSPPAAAPVVARPDFDVIRRWDQAFSRVVFEDFVYSLYAEVQRARGMRTLERLSAYLSSDARGAIEHTANGPVEGVIVGAMRLVEASATAERGARIVIELESNYTEGGQGWYVVERWTLVRGPGVKSRTPDRVRVLGCPNCGAPQDSLFAGICKHCQRQVNDGSFDWSVKAIDVRTREARPPILTANVEEKGTDAPTQRDHALSQSLATLCAKDPAFDVRTFEARVGLVFQQFQMAWSSRNLAQMRPFMSDALFTTQQYWINAYVAQQLRNVTEGARITRIEVAKVSSDPFFDAITVRLFATGLDYVLTDEGKLVSGSRSKQRAYSEYWTFIRGTNRKGPARTDLACSNCGGPLDVSMVGQCKSCNVKVTTGDFDWVLSRIEQDESYSG